MKLGTLSLIKIPVVYFLTGYILIAFILKELNPFLWEEGHRCMYVVFAGVPAFIHILTKLDTSEE